MVTSDDRIVPLLGAGEKKWKASVELLEGPTNGRILGTKQVQPLFYFTVKTVQIVPILLFDTAFSV